MQTRKYLFFFGYRGTNFLGLQKQSSLNDCDNTITRYLEQALLCLSPLNYPTVYGSSRTDTGVHAIKSTFQTYLALPPSKNLTISRESYITHQLNEFLFHSNLDIRIHKTLKIPEKFNCRLFPSSRTYFYKLAIDKSNCTSKLYSFPITELNSTWVPRRNNFDLNKAELACELLRGKHDFKAFSKNKKKDKNGYHEEVKSVRTLQECKIIREEASFETRYDPRYKNLEFYGIIIKSKGFLWQQVRRLVGAIVNVAQDELDLSEIKYHLENPDKCIKIQSDIAPAHGLYLTNIEYPAEAFKEETYKDSNRVEKLYGEL